MVSGVGGSTTRVQFTQLDGLPFVTAKQGENLSSIARRLGVSLEDLKAANPHLQRASHRLGAWNYIQVGEPIRIPSTAQTAAPARVQTVADTFASGGTARTAGMSTAAMTSKAVDVAGGVKRAKQQDATLHGVIKDMLADGVMLSVGHVDAATMNHELNALNGRTKARIAQVDTVMRDVEEEIRALEFQRASPDLISAKQGQLKATQGLRQALSNRMAHAEAVREKVSDSDLSHADANALAERRKVDIDRSEYFVLDRAARAQTHVLEMYKELSLMQAGLKKSFDAQPRRV